MKNETVRKYKPGSIVTKISNNVVPNQLQAYMESNTVPGIKPTQEVITTCSYEMKR